MVWYVQPMQLLDENNQPSGQWRLIARSDEGGGFHECSEGTFDSADAAYSDRASQLKAKEITGFPTPWEVEEIKSAPTRNIKEVCVAADKLLSALNEFTNDGLTSKDLASAVSQDYERLVNALDKVKDLWQENV